VEVRSSHEAESLTQHADHVEVRVVRRELVTLGSPADYSEWEPVESSVVRAQFVIGADGYDSRVRSALQIAPADLGRAETFAMFEFPSDKAPSAECHLSFSDGLSDVMLPLSQGRVRCGFQLADGFDLAPDLPRLKRLLADRAPWAQDGTDHVDWGTVVHFERRLARQFGVGRVWLAGDAAHVTSPLGCHSMNVGMLEVHELVERIADGVREGRPLATLEEYGEERVREWHKLLGVNVSFELLPNAPPWLSTHARRIVPALPASGPHLTRLLHKLGLRLR
jgi:2-polyprenyl-6-methoxyphenol hydroxylase-like FAD-dependent oxidoreductase